MGDYISGPNHTLPTGGMARVRGGLSVNDFVKLITVQEYSAQGMAHLAPRPRCSPKPKASPATPKPFAPDLDRRTGSDAAEPASPRLNPRRARASAP